METWPNFFIVGAPKAGTSSPNYLQDPESPKLIHDVAPNAKIIIILRDPVERSYSDYLMMKSEGIEKIPFHEIISSHLDNKNRTQEFSHYLKNSIYSANVKRFQSIFGANQVKVLIFEEFVREPLEIVSEVLNFLGVIDRYPENIAKVYNPYSVPRGKLEQRILTSRTLAQLSNKIMPRSLKLKLKRYFLLKKANKPQLSEADRSSLENFFLNDVQKLEIILNKKLPWDWIKPNSKRKTFDVN